MTMPQVIASLEPIPKKSQSIRLNRIMTWRNMSGWYYEVRKLSHSLNCFSHCVSCWLILAGLSSSSWMRGWVTQVLVCLCCSYVMCYMLRLDFGMWWTSWT
jgi:hypothetical protein